MDRETRPGDWRTLWDQYGPRLLLFARQQAAAPADAEDIVQDAFIRYWRSRTGAPELTPTLLFTLVRRIAVDYARRSERRQARETAVTRESEGDVPLFEDPAEGRERAELIEGALSALPAAQREVLVLKIWGELTFEEIGQVLEVSPNTAASRYRYGLNQLRNHLVPALE